MRAASLPAPPDADLPRQLQELHGFADSLVEEFKPEHLALRVNEHRNPAVRSLANRGEGAVLAAAGKAGPSMKLWYGASLKTPAGLGRKGSVQECVDALCARLGGEPLTSGEMEQAAAAAAASRTKLGG